VIDYAGQGLNVYLKDMGFDAQGNPVYLYITSRGHEPGPPNDPRTWRLTRWDGTAWQTTEICPADHNYDMGSLYILEDRWLVIGPTLPGPQPYHGGGEMVLWESRDQGKTWAMKVQITRDSEQNHNYARRPLKRPRPVLRLLGRRRPDAAEPVAPVLRRLQRPAGVASSYTMDQPFAEPEPLR